MLLPGARISAEGIANIIHGTRMFADRPSHLHGRHSQEREIDGGRADGAVPTGA